MTEGKKEGSPCSTGMCSCCSGVKFIAGLFIGAFIFAAGMWFAKSHCHYNMGNNFCPFSAPQTAK